MKINRYVEDKKKAGTIETTPIKDAIKLIINGELTRDYEVSQILFNSATLELNIFLQKYGQGYVTKYIESEKEFLKDCEKKEEKETEFTNKNLVKVNVLINGIEAKDMKVKSLHFSPLGLEYCSVVLETI